MLKTKKNVQRVHKVKTTNYISIPKDMRDAVEALPLTKAYKNHCLKTIGILSRESYREYEDIFQMVDIPNNYLLEVFGNRFKEWVFCLLESKIILRNEYYSKESNQCYKYCINSIYYNIEKNINTIIPLCSNNLSKPLSTVEYSDIMKIKSEDSIFSNHYKKCIEELDIDFEKLIDITNKKVEELSISDFRIDEDISVKSKIVLTNLTNQEYKISKEGAIIKAKEQSKSLIQDKNRYLIEDISVFIQRKKLSILATYCEAITSLKNGNYRAGRNKTNNRLDTNLTNLCSLLTDEICCRNNLAQIDLRNSQFAILSWVLQSKLETDDFKRFKKLSSDGDLYDYIKDVLGLESRDEGKKAMFEILFSSRKNNTSNKLKIKQEFPSVVRWIDKFKKENGDKSFAVMLQKEESKIFIDGILSTAIKKKLFALTKHDSLIVKVEDKDKVLKLISDYFDKIGLEYSLKITESDSMTDNILLK